MSKPRHGNVALVFGATSGIGLATARELAENGYHVYGAGRRQMPGDLEYGGGFVRFLRCDMAHEESVEAAFAEVLECEGRLDILVNCAGNGIAGAVEETSHSEALGQFEVNFFGAARSVRLAMRIMREQRQGVIINISSVGSRFALPFQACYSASKAALEALTDAIRLEGAPFGVRAAAVLPGDTSTGFTGARMYTGRTRESSYKDALGMALYAMKRDELSGATPEKTAVVVRKLLTRRFLPHAVTVGCGYKALVFLKRLLPHALVELILRMLYLTKAPDEAVWSFEKDVLGRHGDEGRQNGE